MTAGLTGDLRQGFRQLLRSRSFAIPAVAALAVGIGATTSVFSVVHHVLLNVMGFAGTGRLVTIWQTDPKRGQKHVEVSYGDLERWRAQTEILEDVGLASSVNLDFPLLGDGEPQQVDGATVSGSFFRLLGARPAAGRLFTDDDDRPGEPLRLVISHRLWRTRYGADPKIAGRQIRAGDDTATIIGVTDPDFDFPRDVDLFVPLRAAWPEVAKQPDVRVFRSVAKLKRGVTPAEAEARLNVVSDQAKGSLPPGTELGGVLVTPLLDEIYGASRPALWTLFAAVMVVLLIACANAANLLLARATVRVRELAVRAALGASGARLLLLLMAECVALAVVSSAAGLALSFAGIAALARLAPAEIPRLGDVAVNGPVLAFGIASSFAAVLLFGLGPALAASGRDPGEELKLGGRTGSADRTHSGMRRALILSEVALSMVLLVGAGLVIRSFSVLASLDPGFRAERILTFRITTNTGSQEKRRQLYSQILGKLRAMPGVESAGAVLLRPLSGVVGWDTVYTVQGQSPEEQRRNSNGNYEAISPDYFRTMNIRMLAGRDFTGADTETAQSVVIVNESTARRHWPQGDAVGKSIRLSNNTKAPWLTVTGVVSDVRYREWEAIRPDFYVPYTQRAQHRTDFVVRTSGDPADLAPAVRRAVFEVDPNQPLSNMTTMTGLVNRALARSKFTASVLGVFAACALALASLGLYGVLSYTVAQRTREIGIRMALGATRFEVVRLITAGGFRLAATGAAVGLIAAFALRSLVRALLYGVETSDFLAWVGAVSLLLGVAAATCVVAALRAAAVEPARAIAAE